LFLFFMMNIAGDAIWEFGDEFFKTQNVEDANFATYFPIPEEEIAELEKEYAVTLEPQYYNNIETEGITTRVFKKTNKINLYSITEGEDVRKDNEVIISEGYAVYNKISIGDEINIGDKNYTVSGFFQRPDYLYMLQNESDSYKNVTTFFLAYVTDEEFERIGSENCLYLVCYDKDNQVEFRKEINEKYFMRTYLSAKENMRIDMVKMQAEMFIAISYIILVIMPLIVVVLVSIVINRKVKSEQKMIGTLTALGYKKSKLMLHYAGFAMIPGVFGGVLAAIFTMLFAQPFGEVGLQDYEPMRIECHLDPIAAILGIIIPTIMYILAAMNSVNKLLKKDTVLLLNGNGEQGEKGYRNILVKKKISFRVKYALRSLIGNPSRTFVILLGIFLGSYIALLGYSFLDTMEYTKNTVAIGIRIIIMAICGNNSALPSFFQSILTSLNFYSKGRAFAYGAFHAYFPLHDIHNSFNQSKSQTVSLNGVGSIPLIKFFKYVRANFCRHTATSIRYFYYCVLFRSS